MLSGDTDERLLFHITSGSALVFSAHGKTLMDVGSGEMAGESRFMQPNECGSTATIVAREHVECLVTPFEAVQTLCSMDPLFSARFHRGLAIAVAGAACRYHTLSTHADHDSLLLPRARYDIF